MLTRNLTTFLFGAKVTSRLPPQLEMAMIVRGTFTLRPNEPIVPVEGLGGGLLEQGPMTAEVFAEEDEDRTGGCQYPGDLADYKPHAEVFLVGSCYPAAGKPLKECGVRFTVGSWSKSLFVVGKRTWGVLGPSAPEPFEKMPIGWDHSFGGAKYDKNPSGKGLGTSELPNVELPGDRVSGKSDRPEPAGFGPLSPFWPQRAAKMGKAMFKGRPPYFVDGVDWSRFNGAPPDQQLKGFLQGDEEVTLQNLHPSTGLYSGRLPALRIRAFTKLADGTVGEARMNLDTLLVDTDKAHVVLTWRGHVPCHEQDLSDVKSVLIASEKLGETPRPTEHYKALLEEFHADPIGVLSDDLVPGTRKNLAAAKAATKGVGDNLDRPPAEQALAVLANDDLMTFGVPEEHKAEILKNAASQRAGLEKALAKQKEEEAKVDEMFAKAGRERPPPAPPKTANELAEEAPDIRGQLVDALKKAKEQLAKSGLPPERYQAKLEDLEKQEAMLDEPQTKLGLAMATPPRAAEIGPGKDLSYRNMMNRDLSGLDLSGANLERANLQGARLVGARLTGVKLREAILVNADLTGADLSGADLTRTIMTNVKASGADFRRATIEQSVLDTMDLKGANFGEAKLSMVLLSGSDLTDAKLNGANMSTMFAEGAKLVRADFTDAVLVKTTFIRAKAGEAVFKRATLTNSSFMESDLRGASFVEASGELTNWMKADLGGADFRFAVLHAAHFMDTKAVGTNFYGADLKGSEFIRACLDRALFRKANLFGANLDKAQLNETSFLDASLYEAKLATAHGKGTIFVGANTKKAEMPA